MVFDAAPNIPPDYEFDVNADVSFWDRPSESSLLQNNQNDNLPFKNGIIQQDFNNNDGISFDNNNNNNGIQLLKGEYAYNAFSKIHNFWAGPSYWKFSKNLSQSKQAPSENGNQGGRRKKKQPEKITFVWGSDSDDSSTDDDFIPIDSEAAKKLRQCNQALWNSERLKLPRQCNIPSDLFDNKPKYNRHSTDSTESNQMDSYDADDNDFGVSSCIYFVRNLFNYDHVIE